MKKLRRSEMNNLPERTLVTIETDNILNQLSSLCVIYEYVESYPVLKRNSLCTRQRNENICTIAVKETASHISMQLFAANSTVIAI